jgi:Tfp pilus assembly protein PilF
MWQATSTNSQSFIVLKASTHRQSLSMTARWQFEKALGPDHPKVAQSLENMAQLYRKIGQEKDAEELEKRAAAIRAIKR